MSEADEEWRLQLCEEVYGKVEQHKCDEACQRRLAEECGHGVLDDGFGNVWPLCAPPCGLEIVRPGKVQCSKCEYDPPGATVTVTGDK